MSLTLKEMGEIHERNHQERREHLINCYKSQLKDDEYINSLPEDQREVYFELLAEFVLNDMYNKIAQRNFHSGGPIDVRDNNK